MIKITLPEDKQTIWDLNVLDIVKSNYSLSFITRFFCLEFIKNSWWKKTLELDLEFSISWKNKEIGFQIQVWPFIVRLVFSTKMYCYPYFEWYKDDETVYTIEEI